MNVCPVHIRISVTPGFEIPDIQYQSELQKGDIETIQSYSSLAEFHATALSGTEYSSISPMKPSKTKAEEPKEIFLDGITESERKEVANKILGRRMPHELYVETYDNKDVQQEFEEESNGFSSNGVSSNTKIKIGKNAKKYLDKKDRRLTDVSQNTLDDRKLYAEVVTEATKELLRRSSNSISSSKDDHELSEILQMSDAVASSTGSRPSSSLEKYAPSGRNKSDPSHCISPGIQTTSMPYFSGNPAVELTHGIIHLYKANYIMTVSEELSPPPTNTLCMLSVPATVDAHAILEFTAGFCDTIKRLRIIRDRTPNQYMALITFSTKKATKNFYLAYNNAPFSSLTEEEICHLAFVASIEALPSIHDTGKPASESTGLLPIHDSTELPDCVLCLERMDESVRGVLTILCNHSFHGACLQKWEDLCCPVCRYIQTPEPRTDNKCLVCGSVEDLWICLICGHVGCGRYTTEHAQQHYLETHHNYAMALNDNRVWDYAGDYFVHRLFQNKDDGKLVEQKQNCGSDEREAKIEAIQLECMYLLTSQLDSQRKYWEERLSKVEEIAETDRNAAHEQLSEAVGRCNELDKKLTVLDKEKVLLVKKNEQLAKKYASSLKELTTEKELNKGLIKNQKEWRVKVDKMERLSTTQQKEIDDLKEQLRDVMFYIEAQKTLEDADDETREEIQSGHIVVGASGGQKKKKKTKKK
ncbi:BRCA1-associated protein-like [Styela clava]